MARRPLWTTYLTRICSMGHFRELRACDKMAAEILKSHTLSPKLVEFWPKSLLSSRSNLA